ncbi:hypothetical protein A4A49_44136 [Nicotiana attenuata]|uniref:Carboxypeptidase A inhibitor-like domain-containing protein n=2 Tax=Nicotiana attenuata TaxID=49451 RepID=A0A1J6JKP6_NICAT|nr:hypothetical protein A4A49_44136 [Nicotiana attenuata]
MAFLKLSLILATLIIAATMNAPWSSNTNVVSARDVDYDISGIERRILPQLNTCGRLCISTVDCGDCIICCTCRASPVYDESLCFV